jgi:Rrf2 family protein
MRVSAKADYAVRAAIELAANGSESSSPLKGERIADAQGIPLKFLENILVDLRVAGLVNSRRGPDGGYWLAQPAADVSVADVIRAAEGPLASVRGEKPEDLDYAGNAETLRDVGSPCAPACVTSSSTSRSPIWPAASCRSRSPL